jgi:hypothetical protein
MAEDAAMSIAAALTSDGCQDVALANADTTELLCSRTSWSSRSRYIL